MSQKNSNRSKPAQTPKTSKTHSKKVLVSRRNAIRLLIGAPIVGVAGAAIHRQDVLSRDLHDLSGIGAGKPVIVQIHDPSCQLCRRLMSNTREALEGRENLLYRVADITTKEGKQFQQKHDVPHVTLLIFNRGKLVDTVQGVTPVHELQVRFDRI